MHEASSGVLVVEDHDMIAYQGVFGPRAILHTGSTFYIFYSLQTRQLEVNKMMVKVQYIHSASCAPIGRVASQDYMAKQC